MSNFNFSDCRKAVNQATFLPTPERKAAAMQMLREAMEFISALEDVKPTPTKKPRKARKSRKARKATPSQRVADRQERLFHGKADTPVTPTRKRKSADVDAARKSAQAVSDHTGASARAERKAELKAQTIENERIASLESRIQILTEVLAVHMQTLGAPVNTDEVSIEELTIQL